MATKFNTSIANLSDDSLKNICLNLYKSKNKIFKQSNHDTFIKKVNTCNLLVHNRADRRSQYLLKGNILFVQSI